MTAVSIGLPGLTPGEIVRALAPRIERLGFSALWINDNPGGDSLDGVRIAAGVTTRLKLGTGVIPLDRRPVASLDLAGLPDERLTLGIGSGGREHALARVRAGIDELTAATAARVFVGALGPRMRALAAKRSDGVLLNWLDPDSAAEAMADLRRDAGKREVTGSLYVRTITDRDALPMLESEAARYASVATYAANFARLGIDPMSTTIRSAADLALFTPIVDEVVLRAVTPDGTLDQLERFADTAAGWLLG